MNEKEKAKQCQSNLLDQKIDEELKRLKEEQRKLVNSVGEWSALAIDRKQDLDEANKKIEELKDGINQAMSKDYSSRVDLVNDINKIFESLTK